MVVAYGVVVIVGRVDSVVGDFGVRGFVGVVGDWG